MKGLINSLVFFHIFLISTVLTFAQVNETSPPPEQGLENFLLMKDLVKPKEPSTAQPQANTQPQDYYFNVDAVKVKEVKRWPEFHGFVSLTDPIHGRDDPTQRKNVNFFDQTWITLWLGFQIFKPLSFTAEIEAENGFEIEAEKAHFDWNIWEDKVALRAGKFVYPFGIERLVYSAPFNKLVDRPSPSVRIVPGTYSDVGVQLYGTLKAPYIHGLKYELAVTNGLDRFDEEGKQDDLNDNNSNKQLGGRLALLPFSWIEIGGSYLTGKYDMHNNHRLYLAGTDLRLRKGGLELRGEYMTGRVDAAGGDFFRHGYYLQTSYRHLLEWNYLHYIEGVIRYDSVDPRNHKLDELDADRLAFGFNLSPRQHIDIKLEYEKNLQSRGGEDNVLIQAIFRW